MKSNKIEKVIRYKKLFHKGTKLFFQGSILYKNNPEKDKLKSGIWNSSPSEISNKDFHF
jgi:hypothetical protein